MTQSIHSDTDHANRGDSVEVLSRDGRLNAAPRPHGSVEKWVDFPMEVELGEQADPDLGGPMDLTLTALINPNGTYVLDHFVVGRVGPRGGSEALGNCGIYQDVPTNEKRFFPRRNGRAVAWVGLR